MLPEEKRILLQEIPKYINQNCYFDDGTLNHYDLWLVGWVAAEFVDRRNAMKVLINNEYGLLGNLLNKLARTPDGSITRLIERTDLDIMIKAINQGGKAVLTRNEFHKDAYAMRLLIEHDVNYAKYVSRELLDSKEFLISIVSCCPELLREVFSRMFDDEDFVFSLIKKNPRCLTYLPPKFRSDYR